MKTAFSFWQDRIAPVFDVSRQLRILETQEGRIVGIREEQLPGEPSVEKTSRLVATGVGTLICGAISRFLQERITASGIDVIPFISGNIEDIVDAWLKGRLAENSFRMPGCFGNPGGRRFRGAFFVSRCSSEGGGFGEEEPNCPEGGPGRRGFFGNGSRGNCFCPRCGFVKPHEPGTPCVTVQCPRCGSFLARQDH